MNAIAELIKQGRWEASEDRRIAELMRQRRNRRVLMRRAAITDELVDAIERQIQAWVPFGTHAMPGPCPPVEFSDEVGDDGLPEWERLDRDAFPAWLAGIQAEARQQALLDTVNAAEKSSHAWIRYTAPWLHARVAALAPEAKP